jgi:hypothetical protein
MRKLLPHVLRLNQEKLENDPASENEPLCTEIELSFTFF